MTDFVPHWLRHPENVDPAILNFAGHCSIPPEDPEAEEPSQDPADDCDARTALLARADAALGLLANVRAELLWLVATSRPDHRTLLRGWEEDDLTPIAPESNLQDAQTAITYLEKNLMALHEGVGQLCDTAFDFARRPGCQSELDQLWQEHNRLAAWRDKVLDLYESMQRSDPDGLALLWHRDQLRELISEILEERE